MTLTSPGRIRTLAATVVNQLAAGEVVENAIGARAKTILVEIEQGGTGRSRIKEKFPRKHVDHNTPRRTRGE